MDYCCDDGRKDRGRPVPPEHKFDYINLSDFKSHSCFKIMAYLGIYFGTIISIACYIADMYTVITLLALGTWSNTIQKNTQIINFDIARIIFAVCIFLSFIILVYDWFRAIRVIRRNGVAEAYMNVIAVRWSCIWGGKGTGDTGWKRFLVFARLTDSRGWVDYIALFTYFALKGWVRIIFAEGPRVVINALTLISVTKLKDGIENKTAAMSILKQFWKSVEILYAENKFSVITLATMAFTTLFWIIAVLRLLLASILYITFLWHHMGGVSLWRYCKERLDTRMGEIVMKKHEKALAKDKERFGNRQPTVPVLNDIKLEPEKMQHAFASVAAEEGFANSTTNLMPPSRNMSSTPALSTISIPSTLSPAPLPVNMQREPRVPSVVDQFGEGDRIRPPPPVRAGTEVSFSSTEALLEYREQKEYSPLERKQQNNFDTSYSQFGPQEYQMQQLPPAQQQQRNGGGGGYMPQGRFPINGRPLVPPQPTASPAPSTVMDLPQDNPFPTFPTAAAEKGGAGERRNDSPMRTSPTRAGTAPPREGYGAAPQNDQMPPPLRTGTAPLPQSRGEGGYGGYQNQQSPPSLRSGTAPPQQMMPPARTGTAPPPQSRGGYGMPPPSRSGTAPLPRQQGGGYGGYAQQNNDWGAQPPRAGTAPPPQQSEGYGQDVVYGGYGNDQGYGQAPRNQGYGGGYSNGRPPPARNYGGGYGQPPSRGGYGGSGGGMV